MRAYTKKKILFSIFISFSLLLGVAHFFIEELFFNDSANKVALDNAARKTLERESFFKDFLRQSEETLIAIRNSTFFNEFLNARTSTESLQSFFLSIAQSHGRFMQLKYIDANGHEVICIDRHAENDPAFAVPATKLQDKSNRYYFFDSKNKKPEKVWYSALDLNIEKGRVQTPFRPTLRAMYPVEHQGEFSGILIINYLMDSFLQDFMKAPLYDMILCDGKGYTLSHYEKEKSWGFYREEKYNISQEFPKQYRQILSQPLLKTDHFVSRKLDLPLLDDLYLILQLNKPFLEKQNTEATNAYIIVASFIFIFSLLLSLLVIRFFSHALLDIKELTELTEKLESKKQALEELTRSLEKRVEKEVMQKISSARLFQEMLDSAKNSIVLLDNDLRYVLLNRNHKQLHDLNESAIGKTPAEAGVVDQDLFEQIKHKYLNRVLDGESANFKHWFDIKNGERKYFDLQMTPFIQDNKIQGMIVITKDITQEHLLEQQNFTNQKKAAMGDLIGVIAHQLKQPIHVIALLKDSIKTEYEQGSLNQEFLDQYSKDMHQQILFMASSIDELRNFFRPDKKPCPFYVKKAIQKSLKLIEKSVSGKGIKIIKKYDEDGLINGIENELEQVIINLITNSKEALLERKIKDPCVSIFTERHERRFVLIIEDNGGGIPEEIIGNVFDSYFTTKGDKGTGIGLNLAKMIIEESMGGTIRVQNAEVGARFIIELPLTKL